MPTIKVEDGTLVDGANSYVSLSDAETYAIDRGLWEENSTSGSDLEKTRQIALIRATDWLNSLDWKGIPVNDREMAWPREGVFVHSKEMASNVVPSSVKTACIEACVAITNGTDFFEEHEYAGKVTSRSVTVGPITESYSYGAGGASIVPRRDAITARVEWLLKSSPSDSSGSTVYTIGRA